MSVLARVTAGTNCCTCVFLPSFISCSSGQWCSIAGMAGIQEEPGAPCRALPCQLFTMALLPSPAAAQLDSIGFSIIKKCIHAVETRGRAALGLGLLWGSSWQWSSWFPALLMDRMIHEPSDPHQMNP